MCVRELLAVFLAVPILALSEVSPVTIETTATQAVLSFQVIDPAHCTVQLFLDEARTLPVDDTSPRLFDLASQCTRAGSALQGNTVAFVAGLRRAEKAADGKFHSRALAAVTRYYYTIVDTSDSATATGSFVTRTLPLGNLYPEQPPFDEGAWDKRAYPQFEWNPAARDEIHADPQTGQLVKRVTFAGDAYARSQNSVDGIGAQLASAVATGGDCTLPANLNTSGKGFASCAGEVSLFLPLPAFPMSGGGTFNNWYPRFNVDDLILYVYGWADSPSEPGGQLAVCLAQGAELPCLSKTIRIALPHRGSNAPVKVPAERPAPVFANWGYTPLHGDVVPTPGTVTVHGNSISLTNPDQATTAAGAFNIDWPAGSKIYIQGSSAWGCKGDYCTIASIQSAAELTTVETCSTDCPVQAKYNGAAFGFKVMRAATSGTVHLSFGFEADMSTSWSVLEDGVNGHCNANPVTVSNDGAGRPYPGFTRQGYLCMFQHEWAGAAYWLFISKDEHGNPLGEARPLGPTGIPYTSAWNSNGAANAHGVSMSFAGWHPHDGSEFFATASYDDGKTLLLVAAKYDAGRAGCSAAYRNWVGAQQYVSSYSFPASTCFSYTNRTNPSANPPMDLRSQIVRAYAKWNPGFDLSGFQIGPAIVDDGYARVCLAAPGTGDRKLEVCGTFDANSGELIQVFDSFSKYPGRWGYVHGPIHTSGTHHSLTLDQPYPADARASNVLYGPFEMTVTAVNRSGFAAPPRWTAVGLGAGTAIAASEAYDCPTGIPPHLTALGAVGKHCIQVKVSSEPCSHAPGSAPIYPGGKTEAQQFPCTATGGESMVNPAWSKLQNVFEGDWVRANETGNDYGEVFIVAKKDVVSPNDIRLWLVRGGGVWQNNAQPPYSTISASHPDGFALAMTANGIAGAASWIMDAGDPSVTWAMDNPAYVLVHGTQAVGSTAENRTIVGIDLADQKKYAGFFDLPVTRQIMMPLPDLTIRNPVWAGSKSQYSGALQDYMNNDQVSASAADRRWVVNYRHLNPAAGNGPEHRSSPGAAGALTRVADTTQVYKIDDPYSAGPPDPKRLPFITYAGRFLLRDVSSPDTTSDAITDATPFSACYALRAGECRTDSRAGDRYVSVPFAAGENQCLTNQYEQAAPCFFNASPVAGKTQEMDISGPFDPRGARQRMLSSAFTGVGGQYQYSAPKMSPDGAWMFLPCWWLNGVRSEVCAVSMPPAPPQDSIDRTTFVPYDVAVSGSPGDQVRICWGYAENGPVDGSPDSLFPTTRRERGCSATSSSDPFLWAGEAQQYTPCSAECTVRMNLIPERVAYYVVERRNRGVTSASPVRIAVQP